MDAIQQVHARIKARINDEIVQATERRRVAERKVVELTAAIQDFSRKVQEENLIIAELEKTRDSIDTQ